MGSYKIIFKCENCKKEAESDSVIYPPHGWYTVRVEDHNNQKQWSVIICGDCLDIKKRSLFYWLRRYLVR